MAIAPAASRDKEMRESGGPSFGEMGLEKSPGKKSWDGGNSIEPWKKGPLAGLGYIGDEILPSYIGDYFINQYKDPY